MSESFEHLMQLPYIDVTGLTPTAVRWTLLAAPIAEALWIGGWLWWQPALAAWWRLFLPLHWLLNWLPMGATDGARFWATWPGRANNAATR
jgi:hypothetical protein